MATATPVKCHKYISRFNSTIWQYNISHHFWVSAQVLLQNLVFKSPVWSSFFAFFEWDRTQTDLWKVEIYRNHNWNQLRPQLQLPPLVAVSCNQFFVQSVAVSFNIPCGKSFDQLQDVSSLHLCMSILFFLIQQMVQTLASTALTQTLHSRVPSAMTMIMIKPIGPALVLGCLSLWGPLGLTLGFNHVQGQRLHP